MYCFYIGNQILALGETVNECHHNFTGDDYDGVLFGKLFRGVIVAVSKKEMDLL